MVIKSAILIKKENTFLLVQENAGRVHGLWNLPQGSVEDGENIEQTAIREAKEETGLDIKLENKLVVLADTFSDTKELHIYSGVIIGGEVSYPTDEIMNVQFFTFEQIEKMKNDLVGGWVFNVIKNYSKRFK